MQWFAECHHLIIYTRACAGVANLGMYVVREVQHRGTFGEFEQVALWREDKYFVLIEIHLELVHHLHVVARLQNVANVVEPVVKACLALHSLVSPVCSDSSLRNLVHTLRPYLHLHPFLFRSKHCDMQALVAV